MSRCRGCTVRVGELSPSGWVASSSAGDLTCDQAASLIHRDVLRTDGAVAVADERVDSSVDGGKE
jgi:hypothetical protein